MGFNQFSDEYTFLPASGVDIKVPRQQERKTSREVTNTPLLNTIEGKKRRAAAVTATVSPKQIYTLICLTLKIHFMRKFYLFLLM